MKIQPPRNISTTLLKNSAPEKVPDENVSEKMIKSLSTLIQPLTFGVLYFIGVRYWKITNSLKMQNTTDQKFFISLNKQKVTCNSVRSEKIGCDKKQFWPFDTCKNKERWLVIIVLHYGSIDFFSGSNRL